LSHPRAKAPGRKNLSPKCLRPGPFAAALTAKVLLSNHPFTHRRPSGIKRFTFLAKPFVPWLPQRVLLSLASRFSPMTGFASVVFIFQAKSRRFGTDTARSKAFKDLERLLLSEWWFSFFMDAPVFQVVVLVGE
jgi:hypothetical protein